MQIGRCFEGGSLEKSEVALSAYVKKTRYFPELGATAQLVAVELAERGFVPVICRDGRLQALVGETRSVKLRHVRAGERRKLPVDARFHSIRGALDCLELPGKFVGVESEGEGGAEEVFLVPYEVKWPFRLFHR